MSYEVIDRLVEFERWENHDLLHELTRAAAVDHPTSEPEVVPAGLDEMTPGPYLGAILSTIDLSRLTGRDVVTVMRAQQRQLNHHQAEVYAAIDETVHCVDPDTTSRTRVSNEYGPEEVGAALNLTRRKAGAEVAVALDLAGELAPVARSLRSGDIDGRRAAIISDQTAHLVPEHRRRVVGQIMGSASGLTTGQITARLSRLCIETDPDQAQSRYQFSQSERRVVAEPNAEGTAALIITECSPEDVYAARDHVNRLAQKLKTATEPRTIDQLRADVAIGLLTGTHTAKHQRGGSVNVHVDLTTLARLSRTPGELDGYGPVIAEIARKVAREQTQARWTGTVTDPETGEPLHTVALRRRPSSAQKRKIIAFHPNCVFPGCRMPAIDCDLDHRIDHARGGPTTVANHAPLCRRHHRTKHKGGWRYQKRGKTLIQWTSPLGAAYQTTQPP